MPRGKTAKSNSPETVLRRLRLSLNQASVEFSTTRETIRRGAKALDIEPGADGKYSILDIHRALSGDLKAERTRRERAEADRAEVEAAKAKEEVIGRYAVRTYIRNTFAPVREDIAGMTGQLAAKCNPEHPEIARATLDEWVSVFMKRRREYLPTEKPT